MPESQNSPLVVIAAPNGARLDKSGHEAVPLSLAEIADCAADLATCGVSVLHLHVRDDRGRHILDTGRYREATQAIEERVGHSLVVQVTTEAVGMYSPAQQMALVRGMQPEAVSLALRELCPDSAAEPAAGDFFRELAAAGIWAQYILYSATEVERFEQLRRDGFFGEERPFALFVLGRYSKNLRGDPAELEDFLGAFDAGAFPWAVCCFGPREAEAITYAAARGGHVRIGFENNLLLPDGSPARDNAALVEAELAVLRASCPTQRPLATADWVRTELAGKE